MANSTYKSLSSLQQVDWLYVYIVPHRSHKYVKFGKTNYPLRRFEEIGIEIFDLTRCILLKVLLPQDASRLESSLKKRFAEFRIHSSDPYTVDLGKNGKSEWYSPDVLPLLETELKELAQSNPHERIELDMHSEATLDAGTAISSTISYVEKIYRHKPKAIADDKNKANETQTILTKILTLAWRYSKLNVLDNCFLLEIETIRNQHVIEELAGLITDLNKVGKLSLAQKSFIRSAMCSKNSACIIFNAFLEKMPRYQF